MKKRKKWIVIGTACILSTAVLTACGKKKSEDEIGTIVDITGMDTSPYHVEEVQKLENGGYKVNVTSSGFEDTIRLAVTLNEDGSKISKIKVLDENETEGLGSRICEEEWLSQFDQMNLPIKVAETEMQIQNPAEVALLQESLNPDTNVTYKDGHYEAEATEFHSGYKGIVTLDVSEGHIRSVTYDAISENGTLKSDLSKNGEYIMTDTGLLWHEQAQKFCEYIIAQQNASLIIDDSGKTDAISGVSIALNEAQILVQECLNQARDIVKTESSNLHVTSYNGTNFDAVTGATITSKAFANAINGAYFFIKDCILN